VFNNILSPTDRNIVFALLFFAVFAVKIALVLRGLV
jgi:hypothetical protein